MEANHRLKIVLCWHMHQPDYRDTREGAFKLPWTYLHAIKDYVDMVAHLEAVPEARVVVNFVPVLLDQLVDYSDQIRAFFTHQQPLRDPLLNALVATTQPVEIEKRRAIATACLRANQERMIERFAPYARLTEILDWMNGEQAGDYLNDQFLVDLVTWYHLAWLGETVRRDNAAVKQLIDKKSHFSLEDRWKLAEVIADLISGIIPRYRHLAESRRIELSMSPYTHPILPLLLDFRTAHEISPGIPLPEKNYPGGLERAQYHIEVGRARFHHHFGFYPQGIWPAEGGLSGEVVRLFDKMGFRWTASGSGVIRTSVERYSTETPIECGQRIHYPYKLAGTDITCFFRDDGLADDITFSYPHWHSDDAVDNLIQNLENIAKACPDLNQRVVSIILDGENAWEYYPENGYYFLSALYRRLTEHPQLVMTTFSECIESGTPVTTLKGVVAGSWVYGNFSTWIGEPDKNLGWTLLIEAKEAFDRALAQGIWSDEQRAAIEAQLALCEGSDWFWWFGDYNPQISVRDFESLYRTHLQELYRLMGVEAPPSLKKVISKGGAAFEGNRHRTWM